MPICIEDAEELWPEVPEEVARPAEVITGQTRSLSPVQFDQLVSLLPLWWKEGGRHALAMAIAGVLAKEGYAEAEADRLVIAVCGRVGDTESLDRRSAVRDTYRSGALGQQVVSWSGIEGKFPDAQVANFRNILNAPMRVDRGPPVEDEDSPYETPFRLTVKQDFPAKPMLIQGIIPADPRGVVGYLAGLSQSFKSYLALDWGCCVSLGREWQTYETTQTQVLYVAGEGQYKDLVSRLRAWEAHNGTQAPDFFTRLSPIRLDHPERVERALASIAKVPELKPGLVILDTLSQCAGDIAENSSDDARRIYQACKLIGERFGATVLILHHSGKADGALMRGSSALFDDADFVYGLRRPGWDQGQLDCTLGCWKIKNSKPIFNHQMKACPVTWEHGGEKGTDLVLLQVIPRSKFEANLVPTTEG